MCAWRSEIVLWHLSLEAAFFVLFVRHEQEEEREEASDAKTVRRFVFVFFRGRVGFCVVGGVRAGFVRSVEEPVLFFEGGMTPFDFLDFLDDSRFFSLEADDLQKEVFEPRKERWLQALHRAESGDAPL